MAAGRAFPADPGPPTLPESQACVCPVPDHALLMSASPLLANVGNQDALLRKGNVQIVLEEPHMSRSTSLIYMTDTFDRQFSEYQAEQERERQQRQGGQL